MNGPITDYLDVEAITEAVQRLRMRLEQPVVDRSWFARLRKWPEIAAYDAECV